MTPTDLARLHERAAPTSGWSIKSYGDLLAAPGIVLEPSDHGFALARRTLDEAEILMIAVAPEMQGQGIGTALLSDILKSLKNEGVRSVFLEVATTNAPARKLYEKAGFAQTGVRKGYYKRPDGTREDAFVLQKSL